MEDALRALHQLSLPAPSPAQLLDLLDSHSDAAERVAQLIALASAPGEGSEGDAADLLGADLLTQAVRAILANLASALEAARAAHEKEREQLQKPAAVKMLPRKAHVARSTAALKRAARAEEESGPMRPRLVFDGGPSYVSRASLAELEPISAADMKLVPRRYEGRVLYLRTVAPPVPYVGLLLEGEDVAGNIVPVAVSHATVQPQGMDAAAALFPVGTLIAIKEPYLSPNYAARAAPGKPLAGIRIDSPTDLKVFRKGETGPPGFELAPAAPAAASASLPWLDDPVALETSSEQSAAVTALLAAGRPGAAWRLLQRARTAEKSATPEHLALEGRIRYHAEDWAGAAAAFEEAMALSEASAGSDLQDGAQSLGDGAQSLGDGGILPPMPLQACLRQARAHAERFTLEPSAAEVRGLYFAAAAGARRLDVRTYVGPAAVRDIEGAGRGLVATRDVQPGEVILLCRAVAPQYPSGPPVLRLNLENGLVSTSSQIAAQSGLIHALVDRPELQLPVLGLTAGPDLPYSAFVREPYPVSVPSLREDAHERPAVDAAYVDGVLRFNAFGPSAAIDAASGAVFPRAMPHPLPAILNHACLPNVSTTFHGDVLLSRALVPLPKGIEIVHPYVRGELPYAVRQAQLSKHAFQCACELCRLDAADGDGAQMRARLVAGELPAILARSGSVLKMRVNATEAPDAKEREAHEDIVEALEGIIDRMAATYQPGRGSLRPELFDVFRSCAAHRAVTDPSRSAQCELDALACAGAEAREDWAAPHSGTGEPAAVLSRLPALHLDASIEAMLASSTRLEASGQPECAIRWTATAVWAHDCIIGGGLDVLVDRFGERYGPALRLWQQRFGRP